MIHLVADGITVEYSRPADAAMAAVGVSRRGGVASLVMVDGTVTVTPSQVVVGEQLQLVVTDRPAFDRLVRAVRRLHPSTRKALDAQARP